MIVSRGLNALLAVVFATGLTIPEPSLAAEADSGKVPQAPLSLTISPDDVDEELPSQAQTDGALQFTGLSGTAVTGSVSQGYTVYVRDGDEATLDLKVKNTSGTELEYVTMTSSPSYGQGDDAFEPIMFSPLNRYNPDQGVTGAEYNGGQWKTSESTGVGYPGYFIGAGATATFQLKVNSGDLATGTYNWNIELGRIRYDYERTTEYFNGIAYDDWPCVGSEVEATYVQIPLKVVIYKQANATLKVGKGSGFIGVETPLTSSGIDFGTVNLAGSEDQLTGQYDVTAINAGTRDVLTDSYGNATSISVVFGCEITSSATGAFSWGNGTLYDTKWAPLTPETSTASGGYSISSASYTISYDAAYLIAGTYTGEFIVHTTPHNVTVNGQAGNDSGEYRFPIKLTLTGTNPRLYPRAADLKATAGNGQVELAWTPAEGAEEYTEYDIWRRDGVETQTNPDKLDWNKYEKVGTKTVGFNEKVLFVDAGVENGKTYSYTVICGEPWHGYAAKTATAKPLSSIQSRLLAPESSAYGIQNYVEVSWRMHEAYGGSDNNGAGMVDHFNIYRDGVLVDQVGQSAVDDEVSLGWHDDGAGGQVYGITGHEYSWTVNEPVPELYVPYNWTVSAVSLSGVEGCLDEEESAWAYGDVPVILGHEAYFDDEYYYYDEQADDYYEGPANVVKFEAASGYGSPEEYTVWRSAGTSAPDITKAPYQVVSGNFSYDSPQFIDKGARTGQTYTYTVRAIDESGLMSEPYTFTMKSVAPTEDSLLYFASPDVEWSIVNGTSARLEFEPYKNITARVYRNGTQLKCTPDDGYDVWYFDVKDDPGADGTYVYRVEYEYSGVTTSREFTFVRNTELVDLGDLLQVPDAPALSGRTSGAYNVILSWTPAETGGVPEGYHIYRTDSGVPVLGGRYVSEYHWYGNTDAWYQWGNGRYISIQDGSTLCFVDGNAGTNGYYKDDKYLGKVEGLSWYDDKMPHEYWITAYNRAGESAPSRVVLFDTSAEDAYGNAIAPANPVEEAPAAPAITKAWVDWEDDSSMRYFDPIVVGNIRSAWDDAGFGGDIDQWTLTYTGTHNEDNGLNPPHTDTLEFHTSLVDPASTQGTSEKNAPGCYVEAQAGSRGELGRTISVTVTAENQAGSAVSEPMGVYVASLPRFRAAPDNGGALLQWTDLVNDAETQVASWEIWRKPQYGLWERLAVLDAGIAYAGVEDNSYNRNLGYYAWHDDNAENGWTYQYKVVATCADGIDRPSVVREVTPERTKASAAPGAPSNLGYRIVNGEVQFSWDAPETGGTPQHYRVMHYYQESWGNGWSNSGSSVSGDSTSSVWTPSAGTYRCFVYAYSFIDGEEAPKGKSFWEIEGFDGMTEAEQLTLMYPSHSEIIEVTITQEQVDKRATSNPDKPVVTVTSGEGKVTLSWAACSGATYYTVERENNLHPDIPDVTIPVVAGQAQYTYVDNDAEPGVRYRYIVTARNGYSGIYSDVYATAAGKTRDEQVAERVGALIETLDPGAADFEEQVAVVKEVYDGLTDAQRAHVDATLAQQLEAAADAFELAHLQEKYGDRVAPVQADIDKLPAAATVGLDDEEAIVAARTALNGLPAEARRLVDVAKLEAAEAIVHDLKYNLEHATAAVSATWMLGDNSPETITLNGTKLTCGKDYRILGYQPEGGGALLASIPESGRYRVVIKGLSPYFGRVESATVFEVTELAADKESAAAYTAVLTRLAGELEQARRALAAIGEGEPGYAEALAAFNAAQTAYDNARSLDDVQIITGDCAYAGTATTPVVVVRKTVDEVTYDLAEGTHYTLSVVGSDGAQLGGVGSFDVTVAGVSGSTFSTAVMEDNPPATRYSVTPADVDGAEVTVSSVTYTGSLAKPTVTVKMNGRQLKAGKDYTFEVEGIDAGNGAVAIEGIGNYTGFKVVTFKIAAKQVTPTVKLSASSYAYNGKAKKPSVTVKAGSKRLAAGVDYTVTYASGRKNVGTYKVAVKLKGNYSGSATATFKIVPKGTSVQKVTSARGALSVKWAKQASKMASSRITGYEIQVTTNSKFTKGKKTVKVKGYTKTSRTITGLKAGKKYFVHVRTYKKIGKTTYYSAWSKTKTATTMR